MAPGTLGGRAGACPAAEGGVDVLVQSSGDSVPGDGRGVGTAEGEGEPQGSGVQREGGQKSEEEKEMDVGRVRSAGA